jgi:hypothetical protein
MLVAVGSIDVLDRMTTRRKMNKDDALCVEFVQIFVLCCCTDVVMR